MARAAWVALLLCYAALALAYKPVICMHGFSYTANAGTFHDFDNISQWIRAAHPGQIVVQLDINNGVASAEPMWLQLQQITDMIQSIVLNNASFGGGSYRYDVQTWDEHLVDNFVSMAGVHMGQFGINGWFQKNFPDTAPAALSGLMYSSFFQSTLSVANWWHDPTREEEFLQKCQYLPLINNLVNVSQSTIAQRRQNFLRAGHVTLLGSPQDGDVVPWQSSQFGFYSADTTTIIPMQLQPEYLDDTFGLQTLDNQGRLTVVTVDGVPHAQWLANQTNFLQNILPLLT